MWTHLARIAFLGAVMALGVTEPTGAQTANMQSNQITAGVVTRQIQPAVVNRGRVTVVENGTTKERYMSQKAADNMPIFWNDVLQTGVGGRMRAQFEDGSIFSLGQATRLVVPDSRSQQQPALLLEAGRLLAQFVRSSLPDSRFRVRTKTATCWVSSEESADLYVDAGSPVSTLVMNLGGGVVSVQRPDSAGQTTTLRPGEASAGFPDAHAATDLELQTAKNATADTTATTTALPPDSPCPSAVFRVGGGVTAPRLVFRVEPEYAEAAKQAGVEGAVGLYGIVDVEGLVCGLKVIRSLHPALDQEAIEAVRRWLFEPGIRDGVPVPVAVSIEITFRLLDRK